VSFLLVVVELDLTFFDSFVRSFTILCALALRGLTAYLIEGKVSFFLDFSCELGGLRELEFDLVLRLSDGV